MVNNALGSGSFAKTVLLQDPFIDELLVARKYEPDTDNAVIAMMILIIYLVMM